jgi:glycosyltransferase involved in cell wall biosynthesis
MLVNLDDRPRVKALAPIFRTGYLERTRAGLPEKTRSRVHFHPWLDHDRLLEHYARADVFAFPSVWDEPFGIPVAEAMAAGLPVVATRVGGIPEIVDEDSGLLVEPADADELAGALERLAENARLREQLGAAGRVRAERCFSWDRAADTYRTIFAGPAGERKGAARLTVESG